MAVDLGVGGPTTVVPDPVPHLLICNNVVEGKFNLVVFEDFEHCLSESTLGILWSALYEDDYRRLGEDAFDLGMPDFLLLLEVEQVGLRLLC